MIPPPKTSSLLVFIFPLKTQPPGGWRPPPLPDQYQIALRMSNGLRSTLSFSAVIKNSVMPWRGLSALFRHRFAPNRVLNRPLHGTTSENRPAESSVPSSKSASASSGQKSWSGFEIVIPAFSATRTVIVLQRFIVRFLKAFFCVQSWLSSSSRLSLVGTKKLLFMHRPSLSMPAFLKRCRLLTNAPTVASLGQYPSVIGPPARCAS